MVVSKKTTKGKVGKAETTVSVDVTGVPLDLLSPEEYEAITRANYEHPESKLVLQLFIQVNYLWHLSRHMQSKPSSIPVVDWLMVEMNARKAIMATLGKLLIGVCLDPWYRGPELKKRS
jgi:hypothetical protein